MLIIRAQWLLRPASAVGERPLSGRRIQRLGSPAALTTRNGGRDVGWNRWLGTSITKAYPAQRVRGPDNHDLEENPGVSDQDVGTQAVA
jgi:hypothetical protein